MVKRVLFVAGFGALLLAVAGQARAEEAEKPAAPPAETKKDDATIIKEQLPAYPLDTCVVMGGKLDENAVNFVHQGRLFRLCCGGCANPIKKDPAKYLKMIDEAAAKAKPKETPAK